MVTLIILLVVFVLALIIVPFARQMVLDKQELAQTPIQEKFKVVVDIINDKLFNGMGEVTLFKNDPRSMNLFCDQMKNYLIQFNYSTGNLTIILNYKYFQNELVHKEVFSDLRNLSVFKQEDIAYSFVKICKKEILKHQQKVSSGDVKSKQGYMANDSSAAPTSILSAVYEDLSTNQKMSVINLMFYIAQASRKSDDIIIENTTINQQLLILNLDFSSCKKQLERTGVNQIISDLRDIDEGVMASIILACLQMVHEFSPVGSDPSQLPIGDRFMDIFDKLGYPEDRLCNIVQKMMLLQQKFQ